MIADVTNRTADFAKELRPTTTYQEWLVGEIALATVRIDRCAALSVVDLQRRRDMTPEAWDLQRRREVATLGSSLARDPARGRALLETTTHGVEWLVKTWTDLIVVFQCRGEWSLDQKDLALDLLGIPRELRRSSAGVPLDVGGHCWLPKPADLPAFVAEQIQRLRGLQASLLHDQDDDQRIYSALGLPVAEDRPSRSLRRYEQSCRRSLRWAHVELKRLQAEPEAEPRPDTQPQTMPVPDSVPIPDPMPPRRDTDQVGGARAARKTPGAVLKNLLRQLQDASPIDPDATLDLAMIPARPAVGHGSPPRPGRRA
jgi:hypothetical protein